MTYNLHRRKNIINTFGFFCIGVLIGGFASAIAVCCIHWQGVEIEGQLSALCVNTCNDFRRVWFG